MLTKRLFVAACTILLSLCAILSYGQGRVVTGSVMDQNGGSLQGVTVTAKGTTAAAQTNAEGAFSLSVPAGATTLVFTSVGYATIEHAITGDVVNAVLTSAATSMENVVVIGYGTARKKDLTGAVSTVTSEDFQKGIMTTPEQAIAGKVAGVAITSNGGRPGEGSTIRIRGGSSLLASNDPLIVIDGVPLDNGGVTGAANPLSFINPNDIESYTILKDASSAAIYGSRANNGVILITTKKGRSGKLRINFSTTNSISKIANKLDVLSGDEVRAIVNEYGNTLQKAQVGTANTDWQDVIYQTAFGSDNNLSIVGGIKNLPFRLSVGYLTQSGILRTDKLDRQSVGIALTPSFFDNHLKVDLNFKGAAQQTRFANFGAVGSAITFDPTQPVYMSTPTYYGGYYQWVEPDGSLVLNRNNNPLAQLEQTFDKRKPLRGIGNLAIDYKFHFLPEMRANVNMAFDGSSSTGNRFVPANAATDFLNGGSYSDSSQTRMNTVFDAYLNYTKNIEKHRVDATVGYSFNNFRTKNYYYRALNANRDTIVGSTPPVNAFDIPENTIISYFGRVLYNYDSRYFITASLRRDGSSRFAKEHKWGWFPSVGIAWSLKNDLLQDMSDISEMKLRFGYGSTGQQDGIGNYDYIQRFGSGGLSSQYQFGNDFYQAFTPFGFNANLKWEKLKSYNIALDYGFLGNRINGSIDFYLRQSKDLLNSVPQPTGTNFSAYVLANVGSLENKGVEFTLNTVPVKQNDISLDVNLNITYNQNKITNLTVIPGDPTYIGIPTAGADGVNGFVQLHQVGYPRNTFYLYQQVYSPDGKPIEGLFADRNRDGQITEDDKYLNHSAVGDWIYGLSSALSVKNWNAGFTMRAMLNNYVYNNIHSSRSARNQVLGNYIINNASSYYNQTEFRGGVDIQPASDLYVENASFLRMDNIFVGYNFGRIAKDKAGLRATASLQNAFVITKYSGLDPEVNGGVDNNIYPRPRIFALSLNLDF